jgi:hypothetical protein
MWVVDRPHLGVVVSAGLLYTMLETPDGPLSIPNSTLLAAAVGPASSDTDREDATVETVPGQTTPVGPDGATLAMVIAGAEDADTRKCPEQ